MIRKGKEIYDWSRNVVWGKSLNNKNNFLPRDYKAKNKMIQRLTKREREKQKEKEMERKKEGVACTHGTDMDIYVAFEESYLLMETHTHTHTHT